MLLDLPYPFSGRVESLLTIDGKHHQDTDSFAIKASNDGSVYFLSRLNK